MGEATREVGVRPILMDGESVRAILEGRKTQTRRVARLNAAGRVREVGSSRNWHPEDPDAVKACPYGNPGDLLWVRERWCYANTVPLSAMDGSGVSRRHIRYFADYAHKKEPDYEACCDDADCVWKPSIHMPRWASRWTLEVVSRRLVRVRSISTDDIAAEGVRVPCTEDGSPLMPIGGKFNPCDYMPDGAFERGTLRITDGAAFVRGFFGARWDSINHKRAPWAGDPWVWAVEFRAVRENINTVLRERAA